MQLKQREVEVMQRVKEFIHTNFNKGITIRKLSEMSKLTPIRLQHAFKELYGDPIYTYITLVRMEHAINLLEKTNLSIKEVAWKAGYRGTKKFSPMFKSRYGLTPTDYRKK